MVGCTFNHSVVVLAQPRPLTYCVFAVKTEDRSDTPVTRREIVTYYVTYCLVCVIFLSLTVGLVTVYRLPIRLQALSLIHI